MPHSTILTTQTTQHGTGPTLAIYRHRLGDSEPDCYLVGTIDPVTQRCTALPDAVFFSYDAAQIRLQLERQKLWGQDARAAMAARG